MGESEVEVGVGEPGRGEETEKVVTEQAAQGLLEERRGARDRDAVVRVAKERATEGQPPEEMLSTGVRARIVPVGASLIQDVQMLIQDPPVPTFFNEAKEREEPNPSDPEYLRQLKEAQQRRITAALDAMIMFGVELVDGLPEDDGWLRKLQFLERRKCLDLSDFDLDDPLDREFLFKKYIATGSRDIALVGMTAGIGREDVDRAVRSFRSDEAGVPD